jgi:aquaporin Z
MTAQPSITYPNQEFICLMAHGASEFIATLLLLLAVMGCYALLIIPFVAPEMQTLALAGLVAAVIALIVKSPIGKLSGAHMNPAVSLAFWMERRLCFREFLVYVLMQFGGAITACELLSAVLFENFEAIGFGVLSSAPGLSMTRLLVFEAGATGGLVALLFFVLSHKDLTKHTASAIALYLAAMTLLLAPLTGAGFNPARAYGAALAAHRLEGQWPYVIAPLVGAGSAAILYRFIPLLPRPLYHRLNHSHEHANYTLHFLALLQNRFNRAASR